VVLLGRGNSNKRRGETIEGGGFCCLFPWVIFPLLTLFSRLTIPVNYSPRVDGYGYGRKEGEDDKSSPFFYVGSEAPVHFQPKTPKEKRQIIRLRISIKDK
jgi:hypothetical protein